MVQIWNWWLATGTDKLAKTIRMQDVDIGWGRKDTASQGAFSRKKKYRQNTSPTAGLLGHIVRHSVWLHFEVFLSITKISGLSGECRKGKQLSIVYFVDLFLKRPEPWTIEPLNLGASKDRREGSKILRNCRFGTEFHNTAGKQERKLGE